MTSGSSRTWPGQQTASPQRPRAGERTWPTRPRADREDVAARDRELLEFTAAHPFVRADHAAALLGDTPQLAKQRLRALAQAGLLARQPSFHRQPSSYQITRRGLAAIGSPLPVPRYETVRSYRHQSGTAFIAIAAHRGVYGPVEKILTQREMRALDSPSANHDEPLTDLVFSTAGDHRQPPFRVQLDPDRDGPRHYPDVMLIINQGRVAIELQLHPPQSPRLEQTIAAYGADPHVAVALYLVTDQIVGETIQAAAAKLGLSAPTHVQPAQFGRHPPAELAQ